MNEEVSRDMTGEADGKNQGVDFKYRTSYTLCPLKSRTPNSR